jgi:hypothetical protein
MSKKRKAIRKADKRRKAFIRSQALYGHYSPTGS